MKIYLLTHSRELKRENNTGAIALEHAGHLVERIIWDRACPNPKLLNLIKNDEALLLHLMLHLKKEHETTCFDSSKSIIIIDSTWQESRKIYNKSPYLKRTPLATLHATASSRYTLRRNQVQGGLCTIECIIEVLKLKGETRLAAVLEFEFLKFNRARP